MTEMMDRKKLIEYLPDFMQKFSEMKELMRVTSIESDKIYPLIGKILNEAFIEDCSEYGIEKYERLLGILPNKEKKLEDRRLAVNMYWCVSSPYSYRWLVQTLEQYYGTGNYDVDADFEHYIIDISIYNDMDISLIENFLDRISPMGIVYAIHPSVKQIGYIKTGTVWQDDEIFTLRQVGI